MSAPPPLGLDAGAVRRLRARARTQDAARILPALAAVVLVFAPAALARGGVPGGTASWLAALFAAWTVLIALAALVAWGVRRGEGR
ncbi:hypothetical protein [Jannaschia sp. W003]|uniref:hypothetical protein n=1 Tax=Jannaschia sp. W003 TaxID=2867012 RepID=UPI0021A2779F|nr:hypothetical protein [Jannaschia sp. W003]UWQ20847.1 hypothetical protein K3554_12830 [Jannaschia sp. W003]